MNPLAALPSLSDAGRAPPADTLARRLTRVYAAAFVALTLGGLAVISVAVWPPFEALDKRESLRRLETVTQALESEKARLQELVTTNAVWDDAYRFALGRFPKFPEINLSPDALTQIDVDAAVVLDNNGRILFGGLRSSEEDVLKQVEAVSTDPHSAMALSPSDKEASALIAIDGEATLIAVRRIVRADGTGTSPGALVFARKLGPDIAARMQALTGATFTLSSTKPAPGSRAEKSGAQKILIDGYGKGSLMLRVEDAGEVKAIGRRTILIMTLATGAMLAAIGIAFAAAFHGAVIAPVSTLSRAVRKIAAGEESAENLERAPSDIRELARTFEDALRTARHEATLRLAAEAERASAQQASAAKLQFVANVSHELRTPLNAIIGYSEIISEGAEYDGRKQDVEDVERILRAARTLLALINDVLDFSKLEGGHVELEIRDFDLRDVLRAVEDIAAPMATRKGLRFELDAPGDLGVMAGDAKRLQQCLLNLTSNAIKFTDNGQVTVRVAADANRVRFEVEDTGIGIEESALALVFEPFRQADASITRRFGGTGLGLAITQDFVRLMGGSISVESRVGVGTRFVIEAPRRATAGSRAAAA